VKKLFGSMPKDLGSLKAVVTVTFILNLMDALNTHLALSYHLAEELNPVMAWAWDQGPLVFWGLKILLGAAPLFLFRTIKEKDTDFGGVFGIAIVVFGFYLALVMSQIIQWVFLAYWFLTGQPL
jgi:hypothetical protein